MYVYHTVVINLLQRSHGQSLQFHNFIVALKTSSDEESFIAIGTFCQN